MVCESLHKQPFRMEIVLDLPTTIGVLCKLHLTEAADSDRRETSFECTLTLNSASRRSQNVCQNHCHTFVTQVSLIIRRKS